MRAVVFALLSIASLVACAELNKPAAMPGSESPQPAPSSAVPKDSGDAEAPREPGELAPKPGDVQL